MGSTSRGFLTAPYPCVNLIVRIAPQVVGCNPNKISDRLSCRVGQRLIRCLGNRLEPRCAVEQVCAVCPLRPAAAPGQNARLAPQRPSSPVRRPAVVCTCKQPARADPCDLLAHPLDRPEGAFVFTGTNDGRVAAASAAVGRDATRLAGSTAEAAATNHCRWCDYPFNPRHPRTRSLL